MSIPPLVCSTPPPPEQCEDDKDQEDFDLNYHLSQEEDGNEYDYGDFSTFNHFQCSRTEASQELGMSHKETNHEKSDDKCNENTEINDIEVDVDTKPVILEDDVLEDLNLKIDHEPTSSIQKAGEESETIISEEIKQLHSNIPIIKETSTRESPQRFEMKNGDLDIANENRVDKYTNSNLQLVPPLDEKENNSNEHVNRTCDINTFEYSITNITVESVDIPHPHFSEENNTVLQDTTEDEDGFDDFDDFQFVASDKKPAEKVFDTASENPWQNNDDPNEGFGDFTANFEEVENSEIKKTDGSFQVSHNSEDEFGDFDEFKSVNDIQPSKNSSEVCKDVPVLNLHSTDSEFQIIERINQVMHVIFENEITESDNVIESKLDLSLGETWGYLRETDIRQPYIVNWNNSLAQKTLLKALCIDSRNILFGPKWSSNMPKYAANLSSAPLQPQKQAGQTSTSNSDIINSEKSINKTWTDPFTSDGQEFTYAEALLLDLEHLMATLDQMAHNHSTLKISELLSHACHAERENTVIETGPTDLDVFEAAITTKPDKIYSNTLSIQPMRHINLPDTHIFTPTNSEIPRSKTIHYDSTSTATVLMPQTVQDNNTTSQIPHSENDNDYWEFQDFKGSSDKKVLETNTHEELKGEIQDDMVFKDVTNKSTLPLATQVLQPIKLEPIIPTLNWPDPGEVKEVFDDFSDFISNLPASDDRQESTGQSIASNDVPYVYKKDDEYKDHENKSNETEKNDDDFEMFQSALPPIKNVIINKFVTADSHARDQASTSALHNKLTDFDVVFSKADKEKADNISLNTNPIENVLKNVDNSILLRSQPIPSTGMQTVNTSVLQPTLATPSLNKQSQQKTGQILQPLSLESYSQINWPNPGIDLQDLSRFNPVESLHSFKTDSNSHSKTASPVHNQKGITNNNHTSDEDIWGDFVSSKPKQQQVLPKKQTTFADDEEWTDFVSSPSVNSQNGLNTISLNVHTNSSMQKSSNTTKYPLKTNEISLDIPALNYITPKSNKTFNERHFQNL